MAELEFGLGGEKIQVTGGRIVGGCGAHGLQDLLQSLLRLSHPGEHVSHLALRWKETWVQFETTVQETQARRVLAVILLQQCQTEERGNRIRRFVRDLV